MARMDRLNGRPKEPSEESVLVVVGSHLIIAGRQQERLAQATGID